MTTEHPKTIAEASKEAVWLTVQAAKEMDGHTGPVDLSAEMLAELKAMTPGERKLVAKQLLALDMKDGPTAAVAYDDKGDVAQIDFGRMGDDTRFDSRTDKEWRQMHMFRLELDPQFSTFTKGFMHPKNAFAAHREAEFIAHLAHKAMFAKPGSEDDTSSTDEIERRLKLDTPAERKLIGHELERMIVYGEEDWASYDYQWVGLPNAYIAYGTDNDIKTIHFNQRVWHQDSCPFVDQAYCGQDAWGHDINKDTAVRIRPEESDDLPKTHNRAKNR